jgi:hypothetical protein
LSPFQFGNNNPVLFNDPLGLLVNTGFTESVFAIIEQAWNDTPNSGGGGSSYGYFTYSNGQRTSSTTWVLNKPKPGGPVTGTFRSDRPDLVNASLEEVVAYTTGQALNSIEANAGWGGASVNSREAAIAAIAGVTGLQPSMMWGIMLPELPIVDKRIDANIKEPNILLSIFSGTISSFGLVVESTIRNIAQGNVYATLSGLKGLKSVSSGLVMANLLISMIQLANSGGEYPSDWAKFGSNLLITGTAFIPVAGPFISFGLSLAESCGAFDDLYLSFNDPLKRWMYLESINRIANSY